MWLGDIARHASVGLPVLLLITNTGDRILTLSKGLSVVIIMEI